MCLQGFTQSLTLLLWWCACEGICRHLQSGPSIHLTLRPQQCCQSPRGLLDHAKQVCEDWHVQEMGLVL